ncbi:MAG: cytochrome P450 [Actinobacteria bacterium]|nr:cytochrome P450 [Actinomycetota bacterium]
MFDAYNAAFLEDPYTFYRKLQEEKPVFWDSEWGLTFFAAHRDVSAILKDRDRFGRDFRHRLTPEEVDPALLRRIYPPQWPTWTQYIRESFIDLEPPRHTRLRKLVSAAFTRRSSEVFRPRLEAAADAILDEVLEKGSVEVIDEYATPIPVAMIADLMGIPPEDHPQLLDWSHAIVKVFDERVTPGEGVAAEGATRDFVAYLEDLLRLRRSQPGDDLISAMLEVEEGDDSLSDAEIVGTSILTLNAGHEATVHAIGNSLLALARDPAAYAALRSGEVDIATAVDELLRYDSPLQMFERWVLTDTHMAGTRLVKGSKVGLLFGAANHDPAVFAHPERLDLGRSPNPHMTFGAGLHYCVGAPLARVELEAALGRWVSRVGGVELGAVGERIESLVFRGVRSLELALTAA